MSLRSRIASLLVVLSIALVAIMYAAQELVVMPTFAGLERKGALRNVNRCVEALNRDLQSLSNMTSDWATWDDSYHYLQNRNKQFEITNLADESFANAHLNLICFLDQSRDIVWGEVRQDESSEKIDVPDLFAAIQQATNPLSSHHSLDDSATGILVTSQGPMLLASQPITTTNRKGPIVGALIMGRFISPDEVEELAERTEVNLKLWTIGAADMPAEARRVLNKNLALLRTYIEVVDSQMLHAYRVIEDVGGSPALLLRVDVPREVTDQGRVAARVATACSLIGGAVTLAGMWIMLQRGLVDPLRRMVAHLDYVGQSGDLKARLNFVRTDEIGTLANEFDRMVEKLSEYRKKVLDSAHRSGMEEVASEVLHNVGNAVNSASCSVEMMRDMLGESKLPGFHRAVALLREQAPRAAEFFSTDPRGPKLVEYLTGLDEALEREHRDQQAEVARLSETTRHIRDVIAAQQTYTGQSDFRQEVELASLVDEALLLNHDQLQAHKIQVEVDLPVLPELSLNKSKMTQVLVNVIRNAIQAMEEMPDGARRLTISARIVGDDGVEIEIHDTGHGFDDEVKKKLFAHRFTTKPDGNGLGLHYCANAVRKAGGEITADSPGAGKGATFRIRLLDVIPNLVALT